MPNPNALVVRVNLRLPSTSSMTSHTEIEPYFARRSAQLEEASANPSLDRTRNSMPLRAG